LSAKRSADGCADKGPSSTVNTSLPHLPPLYKTCGIERARGTGGVDDRNGKKNRTQNGKADAKSEHGVLGLIV
jgi:hypothetical protein